MIKTAMKTLLAASLLFGGSALMAEQKKPQEAPKAPKLKPLTPEAEKAAYALFDALKMKEGIQNALKQSLAVQVKRQPAMAPYKGIYEKFFAKYTKWDDMKKDVSVGADCIDWGVLPCLEPIAIEQVVGLQRQWLSQFVSKC